MSDDLSGDMLAPSWPNLVFSFFFQFLDSPSQKITLRDFHQEVTFKQNFYLHQQFMFLCVNCLFLFYLFFFVCVCLDYSRTNEQIFILKFVGRT